MTSLVSRTCNVCNLSFDTLEKIISQCHMNMCMFLTFVCVWPRERERDYNNMQQHVCTWLSPHLFPPSLHLSLLDARQQTFGSHYCDSSLSPSNPYVLCHFLLAFPVIKDGSVAQQLAPVINSVRIGRLGFRTRLGQAVFLFSCMHHLLTGLVAWSWCNLARRKTPTTPSIVCFCQQDLILRIRDHRSYTVKRDDDATWLPRTDSECQNSWSDT